MTLRKTMSKKRQPVELVSLVIKCPEGKHNVVIPAKSVSFRGWEQECSTCGSHGGVDMDIGPCPSCGKTHPVTILMGY
jgi:hypothetical protein